MFNTTVEGNLEESSKAIAEGCPAESDKLITVGWSSGEE
jgi:hypothetical protein